MGKAIKNAKTIVGAGAAMASMATSGPTGTTPSQYAKLYHGTVIAERAQKDKQEAQQKALRPPPIRGSLHNQSLQRRPSGDQTKRINLKAFCATMEGVNIHTPCQQSNFRHPHTAAPTDRHFLGYPYSAAHKKKISSPRGTY